MVAPYAKDESITLTITESMPPMMREIHAFTGLNPLWPFGGRRMMAIMPLPLKSI